jgi:hypothetical protein
MHTNRASTFGTSPSYFFIRDKFVYVELFKILKIFDHTHVVFCPVSFIQMFQIIARKIITIKTELCFIFLKNKAIFDFTPDASNWFISINFSTTKHF